MPSSVRCSSTVNRNCRPKLFRFNCTRRLRPRGVAWRTSSAFTSSASSPRQAGTSPARRGSSTSTAPRSTTRSGGTTCANPRPTRSLLRDLAVCFRSAPGCWNALMRLRRTWPAPCASPAKWKPSLRTPEFAYSIDRGQYHSTQILAAIPDGTLAVTSYDLYVPILTFVFGEAQLRGSRAVVSTWRLREEFYGLAPDESKLRERLLKGIAPRTRPQLRLAPLRRLALRDGLVPQCRNPRPKAGGLLSPLPRRSKRPSRIDFSEQMKADIHAHGDGHRLAVFRAGAKPPAADCFNGLFVQAQPQASLDANVLGDSIHVDDDGKKDGSLDLRFSGVLRVFRVRAYKWRQEAPIPG